MFVKFQKKLRTILTIPILFFFSSISANAYTKISVVGVDKKLWSELKIPEQWIYKGCQDSFIEYPEITEPTIHYCLHFIDENNHKIELKLSRHKGILSNKAIIFDLTDYSESYLQIR